MLYNMKNLQNYNVIKKLKSPFSSCYGNLFNKKTRRIGEQIVPKIFSEGLGLNALSPYEIIIIIKYIFNYFFVLIPVTLCLSNLSTITEDFHFGKFCSLIL